MTRVVDQYGAEWVSWDEIEEEGRSDEDGEGERTAMEECVTCEEPIGFDQAYWYNVENADEIHDGCPFPVWD